MKKIAIATILVLMLSGCNSITRTLGGTITINLPPGEKLETAYWDNHSIDYQTRPMRPGEHAETHTLREKSNNGIAQSTVLLVEHNKQEE